jgi:predicted nucleic acid-binding protein
LRLAGRSVVVDSGVLLALWNPDDELHPAACAAVRRYVLDGCRLVLPVTVLSEVLVGAIRLTPHAVRTVERFVDDLIREVHPVDREIGQAAARLRAKFEGLPLAEALVVATGQVADVQEIVTTNGRLAEVDSRVRVLGG